MRRGTNGRVVALQAQIETLRWLNADQGKHIAILLRERAEQDAVIAQFVRETREGAA